jgi:hypothetical protein
LFENQKLPKVKNPRKEAPMPDEARINTRSPNQADDPFRAFQRFNSYTQLKKPVKNLQRSLFFNSALLFVIISACLSEIQSAALFKLRHESKQGTDHGK